jgi:NADPH2:quinone reductase
MRAWVATRHGAPADVLERRDIEPPEPGSGFVRLRVDAVALGLPDVFMCNGTYPLTPALPFTPGQEAVGVITAVGPEVDSSLVGTRQMGVTAFYLGAGGFAEEALASATTVYPAAVELDDLSAAGFHIPFHTAWIGLHDRAAMNAGEDLVVLGASGGSGSAAVLLGKALGARVIAVVGGPEKVAACRALGADVVVDHRDVDVAQSIRDLTDGRGANVLFDPVGGEAGELASHAMANEGRFLLVGFASGRWPSIDPARLVFENFSAIGVYAGAYDRGHAEGIYAELFQLIGDGRLGSLPVESVEFDELPAALGRLADRSAIGKTVMRVSGDR